MFVWLITAVLIGVGLWQLAKYIGNGNPDVTQRTIKWGSVGLFALLAFVSFGLGRFPLAFIFGGFAILSLAMPKGRLAEMAGQAEAGARARPSPIRGHMTRAEALEILGLDQHPTADEIRTAHKRLIVKNHPDQGGSDYLAAKINQAKDVLLEKP